MNNKTFISGAVILAMAAIWFFWPAGGDEARINQALDQIEKIMSKQGKENPLLAMASLRSLTEYIVDKPRIEIRSRSDTYTDLKALIGMIAGYRSRVDSVDVSITQRRIAIAADGRRAEVTAVGKVKVEGPGISENYSSRFLMEWEKDGDDWKLSAANRIE